MIVVIDYGMGNLGSICNMLNRLGHCAKASGDPRDIAEAEKLVLPGVGAFDAAMRALDGRGLRESLETRVRREGVPLLGICLGAQLLTLSSEEGSVPGLGWIPARTLRFPRAVGSALKVPHMGWNEVRVAGSLALTAGLGSDARFYFVHSYFIRVEDERCSMLKTDYGVQFDSGIFRDNVFGVQFHPEKSHKFGMRLLDAFAGLP